MAGEGKLESVGQVLPAEWVLAIAERAKQARQKADLYGDAPAPPRARSAEAEAMVLALMAKFGGQPDAPPPKPVSKAQGPAVPLRASRFARDDDTRPADATWLHMHLGNVPALRQQNFRPGQERHTQGAWRRALAAVMRHAPSQMASPAGALVAQVRKATATGEDPRATDTYCAAAGWGPAAYAFACVEGLIHQGSECRCQD